MKGIVFKELIGMVEAKFGEETAEQIISDSKLSSEGAYTSVGTYDHNEILEIVTNLSKKTNTPVNALVNAFGKHLVLVFKKNYSDFFERDNVFSFLKSVDEIVHVEVKKLYPDAELPQFDYSEPSSDELIMNYVSTRPFADLAEGLIEGAIELYDEKIELTSVDTSDGSGTARKFTLRRS